MTRLIRFVLGLLCCQFLLSCDSDTAAHTAEAGHQIQYNCAPRKIEIGLKFIGSVVTEYVDDKSLVSGPFYSEVRITDSESGKVVGVSRAKKPIVAWMFPGDSEHIEYLGLQEITLPLRIGCAAYSIDIKYGSPNLPGIAKNSNFLLYARPSRRP
jgi:hypothetical protein